MNDHASPPTERAALPLADAAAWFGITTDALRMRIRRGSAEGFKRDGRVFVYLSDRTGAEGDEALGPEDGVGLSGGAFARAADASGPIGRARRWAAGGFSGIRADYQRQEIERLESENTRLNQRLDRQIEELSEYREMLEREQVLRQQEQRLREQLQQILERLTERQGLPAPDIEPDIEPPDRALLERNPAGPHAASEPSGAGENDWEDEDGFGGAQAEPSTADAADSPDSFAGDDTPQAPAPEASEERVSLFAQRVILRAAERADAPRAEWEPVWSDAAAPGAGPHAGTADGVNGAGRETAKQPDHSAGAWARETSAVELAADRAGGGGQEDRDEPDARAPLDDAPPEAETIDAPTAEDSAAEETYTQADEPSPHAEAWPHPSGDPTAVPREADAPEADGDALPRAAAASEKAPDASDGADVSDTPAAIPANAGEAAELAEMMREIGASLRATKGEGDPAALAGAGSSPLEADVHDPDGLLDTERRNAARIMRRLLRGRPLSRPRSL